MKPVITPTLKQAQVWEAWMEQTYTFIGMGGGAGSGKTWLGCELLLVQAYTCPGSKSFIARKELKRLMGSTFVTFNKVCSHHKIPQDDWKLNGQYSYIEFTNGSRIDLLDVNDIPSDPLFERFGSMEYTNGWIEEAGEVSFTAFDVLKSRIGRHLNKELNIKPKMLLTFNPNKSWLYSLLYKPWKEKTLSKEWLFVPALYSDNPHTAKEYGQMLSSISTQATKERLMLGNWEYDDDPARLINYEAINDLWTNSVEKSDEMYITADIARYGSDKTVVAVWRGFECINLSHWQHKGIDETAMLIRELSVTYSVPYSHILVDADGLGGGVSDILRGIKGFTANATPFVRKDGRVSNFQNLKTQCQYALAECINARKMAIRCTDFKVREMLTEELDWIRTKDADKDGKLKAVPKDEVKEALGRSPDFSDTLVFRLWFDLKSPARVVPEYKDKEVEEYFTPRQRGGRLVGKL